MWNWISSLLKGAFLYEMTALRCSRSSSGMGCSLMGCPRIITSRVPLIRHKRKRWLPLDAAYRTTFPYWTSILIRIPRPTDSPKRGSPYHRVQIPTLQDRGRFLLLRVVVVEGLV